MYKEHYIFSLPQEDQIIWRYMDLWKFEDLINTNELYMASIKKMGDKHESEVPEILREKFIEYARIHEGEDYAIGLRKSLEPSERLKKETYLSSWNCQTNESFALWKIYTSNKEAVAIKSSINRLKNSFSNEHNLFQHIGKIQYHDGIKYSWRGNLYDPVMYKWKYYEFENEVRVVTSYYANNYEALKTHPEGIRVKIDNEELIDSIYLAPNATDFQYHRMKELLASAGLNHKDIYQSGIRDKWSNE